MTKINQILFWRATSRALTSYIIPVLKIMTTFDRLNG